MEVEVAEVEVAEVVVTGTAAASAGPTASCRHWPARTCADSGDDLGLPPSMEVVVTGTAAASA